VNHTAVPQEVPPVETPVKSVTDIEAELAQWERFALKRIPDDLAFEINTGLLAASDETAVKTVFASAREQIAHT
jgi:hypothetical protein